MAVIAPHGVCVFAAMCLSICLSLSSSVHDLTPVDGSQPETIEFQYENTMAVYFYNVSRLQSVYIKVVPCGGEFNWTFSSSSGIVLASGGYSGPHVETGGALTGHHTETYHNNGAPPGVYNFRVETGHGISGFVYFQIYVWSSPWNSSQPQLPLDDKVKAVSSTTDTVSLMWEPSPTPDVEYCVFYLPARDSVGPIVHSSICSTLFTQRGIKEYCTRNHKVDITGLTSGTLYFFNMVVSFRDSHIRSAYVGVQFATLHHLDLLGKWAVVGKMGTEVLEDHILKESFVLERHLREFVFAVERPSKSIDFIIKPCGGFIHWEITAPNGTTLEKSSFKESHEIGFNTTGYLPGEPKNLIFRNPPIGIYKITIRGGRHIIRANQRISFQLFAATTVNNADYYPKLPHNKALQLRKQYPSGMTLHWDPSPMKGLIYYVCYHPVISNQKYFIYSSDCSLTNNTNISTRGQTSATLIDPNLNSHMCYIDVVVVDPKRPQFRSSYIGFLVNTANFTATWSPTTGSPTTGSPTIDSLTAQSRFVLEINAAIVRSRGSMMSLVLTAMAIMLVYLLV